MDNAHFFPPHPGMTLGQLAADIGAELIDPERADVVVRSVAPVARAKSDDLTFLTSRRSAEMLSHLAAAAVLCNADMASAVPLTVAVMTTPSPQASFARAAQLLYPQAVRPVALTGESGISPLAMVHPGARIEEGAVVEPFATVGDGAEIGTGTIIGPNTVVGPGCRIGRNCSIAPHVVLQSALIGNDVILHPGVRIGQDGFGYAPSPTGLQKIVQIGRVIIQDRVEVGANTTIDRGAMDDTVIGEGTKIDNLVQIGHNVRVGRHCAIVGLVAIAGSVTVGDQVMIGGGTTIAGHLTIGSGAQIAGMSAVASDVPAAARWGGIPARPMRAFLRDMAELNARAFNRGVKNRTERSDD